MRQNVASVAFGGSRSLPAAFSPLVVRVVSGCVSAGASSFAVGCASGADAVALSALVAAGAASRVRVFAVGSSSGAGFWRCSALAGVRAAASAGAAVSWLAGGALSVPLVRRLAARSRACVASLGAGGVFCVFVSSPSSRGSFGAARAAVSLGVRVVAFPCGFAGSALPSLGGGAWVPVSSGVFVGGWLWRPS